MRTIKELTPEMKERVDLMLTSTEYELDGAKALLPYLPSGVTRECLESYIDQVVDSAIRGKRNPIECCGKTIVQLLTKIPKRSASKSLDGFKVVDVPKKKRGRPPKPLTEPKKTQGEITPPVIKSKDPEPDNAPDSPDMATPPPREPEPKPAIDAGKPKKTPKAKKPKDQVSNLVHPVDIKKNQHLAIQLTIHEGRIIGVDEVQQGSINPPYYENIFQDILKQLSNDRIHAESLSVDEELGMLQFRYKRVK